MAKKTSESLLDDLDKVDGTDYSGNDPLQQKPEPEEDDEEEGEDEENADDTDEGDEGDDDSSGDDDGEPSPEPVKQKAEGKPEARKEENARGVRKLRGNIFVDGKGNIVDPKTGRKIYNTGAEARLYLETDRLRGEVSNRDKLIAETQRQVVGMNLLNGMPQKLGLNGGEVESALALAADFKKDIVGTARKVVELALAQGYNVSQIVGEQAGDAIEMGGVKRMIAEHLEPLTSEHRQKREVEQRNAAAEEGLRKFYDEHENAEMHASVIDGLLARNPSLTPEKAYYELRMWSHSKGLDWNSDLAPQIAALQNGGQRGAPNRQPTRQDTAPVPRGSTAPRGSRSMKESDMADPKSDWSDILRSVLNKS